jgi:hypothetical protein
MKKTSTLMAVMLAVVFVFSTGTAFAQNRGGHQNGGQHFNNGGGQRYNGGQQQHFDNRGQQHFDNRGQQHFENRGGNDHRDYRGGNDRDYRGGYGDYRGGYDHRDYRSYHPNYNERYYRGSRDWDRYDRYYDRDDYRMRYRSNWGFYGNRGGWRGGIWIGIPGGFSYERTVYETVYDGYGTFTVAHEAYWSDYYGGYVWYDVNGNLRVTY